MKYLVAILFLIISIQAQAYTGQGSAPVGFVSHLSVNNTKNYSSAVYYYYADYLGSFSIINTYYTDYLKYKAAYDHRTLINSLITYVGQPSAENVDGNRFGYIQYSITSPNTVLYVYLNSNQIQPDYIYDVSLQRWVAPPPPVTANRFSYMEERANIISMMFALGLGIGATLKVLKIG